MPVVLICLEADIQNNNFPGLDAADAQLWQRGVSATEQRQTMALAKAIGATTAVPPVIICQKNSALAQALPPETCLSIHNPPRLRDLWKIWRWQQKNKNLQILAIGAQSLKPALKLLRTQKQQRAWAAFFCQPPLALKPGNLNFICGSSYIAAQVKQLASVKAAPVFMPGLDLASWQHEPVRRGEHFIFGMAESLMPDSGALLTVRAMSALWQHENLPPWELRMFGAGSRYSEILAEAETLGVASKLSLLHEQRLRETVPLCDVWLAPGSSALELPEVLDAGFAAGLPVISSRSALHLDRLRDAPPGTSLMVDTANPQELARAMLAVLRDPALRERLAHASRAFRQSVSTGPMAEAFCQLLQNGPIGPQASGNS